MSSEVRSGEYDDNGFRIHICTLCGYPVMKHISTRFADSPTGLLCPTDTRVAEESRLPVKP